MSRPSWPRKTAELSKPLHQQLNSYARAASAAGVGLLALPQAAEAKVVYTPAHAIIGNTFALDLNRDGIVDFYILHSNNYSHDVLSVCQFAQTQGTQFCFSSGNNGIREIVSSSRTFGAAMGTGARIQHGDRFKKGQAPLGGVRSFSTSRNTIWYGPWVNGGKGVKNRYLGLKFRINGQFHFGWARLTITITRPTFIKFTATLTGYAYETVPGKTIIAGQTNNSDNARLELPDESLTAPTSEPPTLGMLALGAPALAIWRREDIVEANSKPN